MDEVFKLTEEELDEIKRQASPEKREWKQRGSWLVCVNSDPEIAIYLGPDKMLVDVKDGKPVIKPKVVKS